MEEKADLRQEYREKGYVIHTVFTPQEVEKILDELVSICKGNRGEIKGLQPILEGETDADIIRKYLAFHFPHKMSQLIYESLSHPPIVEVLTQVVSPNVKSMQTMIFVKGPGKPGQAWHQDEYYIPTRDRSLCGVWIALDNATIDNGCLWVIPKSHQPGVLYPQRPHNDSRFDVAGEAFGYPWGEADAVPVELKSGEAVFFNGYLLHRSLPNVTQDNFRRALATHYMSAESYLPWDWDGRLDPKEIQGDMRDIVMVAGTDPYSHKEVQTNLTHPYIRADKPSGALFNEVA